MKFLIILFFNQILFGIGLEALNIPSSATAASFTGAGIAKTLDVEINPASIYKLNDNFIRFSTYNWLGNVPGNQVSMFWRNTNPHYISLQSSIINDLELYGDIPSDQPLGTFSSSWVAASYGSAFDLMGWQIGSLIKINFSKLYKEIMYGYTTDFGMFYKFSNNVNFGINLKNLGYEFSDNLRTSIPSQFGFGLSIIEPILQTNFLLDFVSDKNNSSIYKIGLFKSFKDLSCNLGFTKQNDIIIYGLGISYIYKNWGINIGTTTHNSTAFDISKYLDFVWYL